MTKTLHFWVDKFTVDKGVPAPVVILERQVSYFADDEGFENFLGTLDAQNPFLPLFRLIKKRLDEGELPREPFASWQNLGVEQEAVFKDFISRLTNFDPASRLTAEEALEHEWLVGVETV